MKRTIKLTENDLHNIIKESVSRILKEDVYDGQELDFAYGGGDGSAFTPDEIKELAFMLLKNPVEEQWKPQYYGFCTVQRVPANQSSNTHGSILSRNPFITCSRDSNGIVYIQIGRKPNTHWLKEDGYTYMAWK